MAEFEIVDRDGWARLGRLRTPHGTLETPALLPVVHPDPARQAIAPREIRARYGLGALITSSYITYRSPPLRDRAEREGIHGLLDFDGPVMTDSGAFQQHAYGHVEVSPLEILTFQDRIGTDIATVLDIFVEPDAPHAMAAEGVEETRRRAEEARAVRGGLLAVPVQGGGFADLRQRSSEIASELGDILAVGGVVPLFEQYRYLELVTVLAAARPHLGPAGVVHLFGTGHPMTFALGALFGVDLYDSSAYYKFARRGRLLFPEGTVALDTIREEICRCESCRRLPLSELSRAPPPAREVALAEHNLRISSEEMGRVRQAIREGTLWELAERRASAHPALAAALRTAKRHPEWFLAVEPESRRAYRETGFESFARPAAERFRARLRRSGRAPATGPTLPRLPLVPEFLERIPPSTADGAPIAWSCPTPFGLVPLELTELYPVGPALTESDYSEERPASVSPRSIGERAAEATGLPGAADAGRIPVWTARQIGTALAWRYGPEIGSRLDPGGWIGERSRRTGRLRTILTGSIPLFQIGNDGIPRPTFAAAERLHRALPSPHERVVVAGEAVEFVRAGRSLFSRFVRDADPELAPGASALLVGPDDELLAVGRLLLAPREMGAMRRGVAAVVSAHRRAPVPERSEDASDDL